jgi:SAM-dependent methyltransferase
MKNIPVEWGIGWPEVEEIYRVEVEQSNKLRTASAKQRKTLYSSVYEEYFQKLPFHPQFTIKKNEKLKSERINYQRTQISPFLKNNPDFMEIGAGDCSLSLSIAGMCRFVYALEVSASIAHNILLPDNTKILLFDGFNIPLQENSIDVAYSNQLMEHLHPDDAREQLMEVFRVLKKGGIYICITPNRISGPHDVSRFFSDKPLGFHLQEYSSGDLRGVLLSAGFRRVIAYTILKGRKIDIPFLVVTTVEFIAGFLPLKLRTWFLDLLPVKIIFNCIVAGVK